MNSNNFLPKQEKFLIKRENNLLLTDYQISILKRNEINYLLYSNYKDLIFIIEELLNDGIDDEELEIVSQELNELYYYNYINK